MDEVGRGTSPEEGVGIAHAMAETLIKSKVSGPFPRDIKSDHCLLVFRFLHNVRPLNSECGPPITLLRPEVIFMSFHFPFRGSPRWSSKLLPPLQKVFTESIFLASVCISQLRYMKPCDSFKISPNLF